MLVRLFSDTDLIKDVPFTNGINIIMGRYSEDKNSRGINGIGKSTLIRLIHFTLLSRKSETRFAKKKYDFLRDENHSITLEFEVLNKKYFIKRRFEDLNTVYFGGILNELEEYQKADMPKILEGVFFPTKGNTVFFEGKRFGTLLEFFVKDDLENQKRFDPFNFSSYNPNAREKALYNFYLLNLTTKPLIEYSGIATEIESYQKTKVTLAKKIKVDTGKEVEQFRTERLKLEKEISILEKSLKDYDFFNNHKDIEERITSVISQINKKSEEYHASSRQLEKIRNSYQDTREIDLLNIEKLYNEAVATFGKFVKKTLEDVINFKRDILSNRNKYLLSKEQSLEKKIKNILADLEALEKERSKLFASLKERGALDRVERTYEELVNEKTKLERNTAVIREIDDIDTILSNLGIALATLKRDITDELKNFEKYIDELRLLFQDILEHAIYLGEEVQDSFFNIEIISNPRKKQLPFKLNLEIPRADALGQERLKVVAYDLMVFLQSRIDGRSLPPFLVHDGAFHGISRKTCTNVLNYMYHKSLLLQNLQYIVTFNEDEIDSEESDTFGKLDFNIKDCTIAEYSDAENGTIFKRFF